MVQYLALSDQTQERPRMGTKPKLSPALETARSELEKLLKPTSGGAEGLAMEDKLLVIDRLIKIEALEHKMGIGKAGSAFDDDDGDPI
jgi:hypothetical protein